MLGKNLKGQSDCKDEKCRNVGDLLLKGQLIWIYEKIGGLTPPPPTLTYLHTHNHIHTQTLMLKLTLECIYCKSFPEAPHPTLPLPLPHEAI